MSTTEPVKLRTAFSKYSMSVYGYFSIDKTLSKKITQSCIFKSTKRRLKCIIVLKPFLDTINPQGDYVISICSHIEWVKQINFLI